MGVTYITEATLVTWISASAMASAAVLTLKVFAISIALASTVSNAVPVEDGGGVNRFSKMQTFSSSMSDINGESEEKSQLSDEAYVNGIPVYLINGERNYNPVDGEHESFDVVDPQENQRIHLDNLNGESVEYQEPVESDEDIDYYENDDEDYPLDSLSIDNWLDNEEDEDEDDMDDSPNYVMN